MDIIATHLEGVSFVHKFNLFYEAQIANGRVWVKSLQDERNKNLLGQYHVYVLVEIKFGLEVTSEKRYKRVIGECFTEYH